jgi:rhomboid family GlyGly-CTERM serine protease
MAYQSRDIPSPIRNGWIFFAFIAVVCYIETFLIPSAITQYDLGRIMNANEYYRFLTAHFVHTNGFHFSMNVGSLFIVALLHQQYYSWWQWLIASLLIALGISAVLFFFDQDVEFYLGLSGLMHGLLAVGIATDIKHKLPSGMIFLACLVGKLLYEQISPPNFALESWIESYVAINAHAAGTGIGFLIGLLFVIAVYRTPET